MKERDVIEASSPHFTIYLGTGHGCELHETDETGEIMYFDPDRLTELAFLCLQANRLWRDRQKE